MIRAVQSMLLALAVIAGVLLAPSAAIASPDTAGRAVAMSYCENSAYYPNSLAGLRWADYPMYQWWTYERLRAGDCHRIFVEHLQVYAAPSTINKARYRAVTYGANGEINFETAWSRCLAPGEDVMLKDQVSTGRRFRIFAQVCGAATARYDISFLVAAGSATR